jgi:hypothetical protein
MKNHHAKNERASCVPGDRGSRSLFFAGSASSANGLYGPGFQVFTQGVKCRDLRGLSFLRLNGDLLGNPAISTNQNLPLVGADNKGRAELVDVIVGHLPTPRTKGALSIHLALPD